MLLCMLRAAPLACLGALYSYLVIKRPSQFKNPLLGSVVLVFRSSESLFNLLACFSCLAWIHRSTVDYYICIPTMLP